MSVRILHGDCLDILPTLAEASVDSVVTDPPYHLTSIVKRFGAENAAPAKPGVYGRSAAGFMGKQWDGGDIAFRVETWRAVYRVMKPGAYLVAFGGTRTSHRMVCAIEDAGFEIRDQVLWLYGSGFPKSLDVSKAIDKAAGAEREVVGERKKLQSYGANKIYGDGPDKGGIHLLLAPATPEAAQWAGWGTALKPACEPIVLARKPLIGTVAANVLTHGTGGLNIDACRIPGAKPDTTRGGGRQQDGYGMQGQGRILDDGNGRWPANVVHDGSDEVLEAFAAFGEQTTNPGTAKSKHKAGMWGIETNEGRVLSKGDAGTAARFFYSAKATAEDRMGSKHPTIKPLSLMDWLVKLITPPGGTVLDPFAGSGTTLLAADRLQMNAIGIDMEAEHVEDIRRRFTLDAPLFAEVNV